jgi:hypothetical protein
MKMLFVCMIAVVVGDQVFSVGDNVAAGESRRKGTIISSVGKEFSVKFATGEIEWFFQDQIWVPGTAPPAVEEDSLEMEPVFRWDPVEIGHKHHVTLRSGQTLTLKTIAMRPAAFEIDNFLSDEECDQALASVHERDKKFKSKGMFRNSNQTWMSQV